MSSSIKLKSVFVLSFSVYKYIPTRIIYLSLKAKQKEGGWDPIIRLCPAHKKSTTYDVGKYMSRLWTDTKMRRGKSG
jgi:hypothetical protein